MSERLVPDPERKGEKWNHFKQMKNVTQYKEWERGQNSKALRSASGRKVYDLDDNFGIQRKQRGLQSVFRNFQSCLSHK